LAFSSLLGTSRAKSKEQSRSRGIGFALWAVFVAMVRSSLLFDNELLPWAADKFDHFGDAGTRLSLGDEGDGPINFGDGGNGDGVVHLALRGKGN
jgi:hypothetical protein